ncbi:MAG: hypothetical protein IIU14_00130 [Ruminococcus sp.]|nr:hypothetical protein [Ruminococcus sp.]
MEREYYVNSPELLNHQDGLTDQKRKAQRLQDKFLKVKQLSADEIVVDPEVLRMFRRLSNEADDLIHFYKELWEVLDLINDDARHVSDKIGLMLEENLEDMRKKTWHSAFADKANN